MFEVGLEDFKEIKRWVVGTITIDFVLAWSRNPAARTLFRAHLSRSSHKAHKFSL